MSLLANKWFEIIDKLSKKPRAGWIREEVGIPLIHCESIWEHALNVGRACELVKQSTMFDIDDILNFTDLGKFHDLLEYIMLDITPHCGISKDEKINMEYEALEVLKRILGDEGKHIIKLLEEYIEQKSNDSKLVRKLDVIDSGIKALYYENLGFKKQVAHFHGYVNNKIEDNKKLSDIYNIMLEREFKSVDPYFQYFTLLELGGNHNEFRYRINKLIT